MTEFIKALQLWHTTISCAAFYSFLGGIALQLTLAPAAVAAERAPVETAPPARGLSPFPGPSGLADTPKDRRAGAFRDPLGHKILGGLAEDKPDDPLTTLLTPRGPSAIRLRARTPQLYETSDGADAFILLINQDIAYIRFLCGSESVLPLECQLIGPSGVEETALLSATRSPRGDVIYKNSGGEAVLRVTATGGATLFTPRGGPSPEDRAAMYRGGRAVLPVPGKSGNISLPEVYYWEIDQRMRLAGDLLSEHLDRKVVFDIIDPEWGNQAVLADALLTAVKAINIVASDELGKRIVAERISEVHFKEADNPSVSLEDRIVYITYDESMGIRGRPSSLDIAVFLESAL